MEKKDIEEIKNSIKELAKFHSVDVPVIYGDGVEITEKMISLAELDSILYMIFDSDEDDDE